MMKKHAVKTFNLLSGAYSLLVTHIDGQVSQWFDVLNDEKRSLTHIRDFQLAEACAVYFARHLSQGFL